jgi:hypothetical protein
MMSPKLTRSGAVLETSTLSPGRISGDMLSVKTDNQQLPFSMQNCTQNSFASARLMGRTTLYIFVALGRVLSYGTGGLSG